MRYGSLNKDAETIICRCEDVTREMLHDCFADGFQTLDEIKGATRAGMGPCQGRTCRHLIITEISRTYGIPIENAPITTFRPPVIPVSLGVLADAYTDDK